MAQIATPPTDGPAKNTPPPHPQQYHIKGKALPTSTPRASPPETASAEQALQLRNARLRHISSDYANYHARTLRLTMGLCPYISANAPAMVKFSMLMAEKAGLLMLCPGMNYSIEPWPGEGINPRALKLFERNVREIVALCQSMNIVPVLVPEVAPRDALPAMDISGWFPYMDGPAVAKTVGLFNLRLKTICHELDVPFAHEVMDENWTSDDFSDGWHLNPEANRRLAEMVGEVIVGERAKSGFHSLERTNGSGRN